MCEHTAPPNDRMASAITDVPPQHHPHAQPPPPSGSRRRRLWELDRAAHCPVVGVCLPMPALRRLVDKALGGSAVADDYALHCGVVTDSKLRSPVAEAVQRELDRRYRVPLRHAALAKSTEALALWWDTALAQRDVAGAFWATLTHPRCNEALTHRVLGQMHMLQHQAGMAARVDLDRFEALIDENAVLARALAGAQQRSQQQVADFTRRSDAQQAETIRLRARLVTQATELAQLQEALQSLQASVPDLQARSDGLREQRRQAERIQVLERQHQQARQEAERANRRALESTAALQQLRHAADSASPAHTPADEPTAPTVPRLDHHAVLCVGGRAAAVPLYRLIVERTGGRFIHHDGGEEDSSARLDATLAAADLVICQTGCVSHNAYWRVKDHCKRTGKRCIFVESPSSAGLKRALGLLAPALSREPAGDRPCPTLTRPDGS